MPNIKIDIKKDKIKYTIPEEIYQQMEKEATEKNITVQRLLEIQLKELGNI